MNAEAKLSPADLNLETDTPSVDVTLGATGLRTLLRACFTIFHARSSALARLSIETGYDLFEMDPSVTPEDVAAFKSGRKEWVAEFDKALRALFERRLAGHRRKRHRPDTEQSPDALRVLSDSDTNKQNALGEAARHLAGAAKPEQEALDYRVSVLFGESPGIAVDNPFGPSYLLDAIGMTSRALYQEPHIWRPLMVRVANDFAPALNQIYMQLNRFLAEHGVVPEIGAVLRARSNLRPADDEELLPLFSRLINEVHPSLQAWRSLNVSAAIAANYRLAPLAVNPYIGAATTAPRPRQAVAVEPGGFPRIDVMMAAPNLTPLLETLDCWQRTDPMAAHLRRDASQATAGAVTSVNRIPWIHAALADQVTDASARNTIDVVGFLFDYVQQDPSIPPGFRVLFDGLQVPILKSALVDPAFFADKAHPARRLIDDLAVAAIGAGDDASYGKAFTQCATAIVNTICAEFILDTRLFDGACHNLRAFADDRRKRASVAMQPHIDAALAREARDTDRSQVRALIRDRLAGLDIPIDVRAFIGTVWADFLTHTRQTVGSGSDDYATAVQTMDDLLWSIAAKERTGQKARLSKMVPSLVRSLRSGGVAVEVSGERMKRFLDALYDLHIAAIKPRVEGSRAPDSPSTVKLIANVHDFVADLVLGTWLTFDDGGRRRHGRLSWISPMRATYVFTTRVAGEVIVFTPEELAWELSAGHAALVLEPVPLFDRAVSATLDYLAAQKGKHGDDVADVPSSPQAAPSPVRALACPAA